MRDVLRRVALGGAVVAAVVVAPAATGAPGAACAAAGETRVRIVVDDGAAAAPSDLCLAVDDGTNGAELLVARARRLGTPPPRFERGYLCAIDGHPETGCGEQTGDGYRYWSYWHVEDGEWRYSNVGAASWELRAGDVEGWRFLDGGAESKAAPPRVHTRSCPAPASTTTPPPPPAPAAVVTTAPAAVVPPAAPTTAVTTATTAVSATTSAAPSTTAPARVQEAVARRAGDGGDGAPVGLLVVAGVIVTLGAAAGLRFRGGRGRT